MKTSFSNSVWIFKYNLNYKNCAENKKFLHRIFYKHTEKLYFYTNIPVLTMKTVSKAVFSLK